MVCKRCGSNNVTVQAVAEQKKRGCLMCLIYLVLCFTVIGIPVVIWLLARGKKTHTNSFMVCQDCGYRCKI